MARFNYPKLAVRADRIMKRFGFAPDGADYRCYLRRSGEDHVVTGLEANFKPIERSEPIGRTDTRFLLSSVDLPFEPQKDTDQFVIKFFGDSETEEVWNIASKPERVSPGGPVVFWQLHCRTR